MLRFLKSATGSQTDFSRNGLYIAKLFEQDIFQVNSSFIHLSKTAVTLTFK
jgi:hypothetical protein